MHLTSRASSRPLLDRPSWSLPLRLARVIGTHLRRRAAAHALYELDEHLLHDIGLGRSEIEGAVRRGRS